MKPPAIDRVLETALYVDDMARSSKFYRDLFGFEVIVNSDRLIAMSMLEKHVLLLFKKGASAALPNTAHDGSGWLHLAFAISRKALPEWRAHLARHGVAIVEERVWERGGTSLYFRDPDGHLLEVATPGVWTIY
jgi:catechol 2,3-dioxygenase-like lactoylglutathione lyase family enzyme